MTVAAIRDLRNALDAIRSEHRSRDPAEPRDDLIADTYQLGKEAVAINIPQFAAVAAMRRAEMEIALVRWSDALVSVASAREHIDSLAKHEHGVFLLRMEAQAYAGLGQWDDVRQVCNEGIAIVEPSREKVSPLTLQSSYLRFRIGLYELAVRAEIEAGDVEAALRVAELVKCRSLSRTVDSIKAKDGDTHLIDDFRRVCEQIDQVVANGGNADKLFAKRRSLWHLIQISRLARRDLPEGSISLTHLQRSLAVDEAVVNYFWMDVARLLVMAFDGSRIEWATVAVEKNERSKIDQLAAALQSPKPPNSAAQLPDFLTDLLLPSDIRGVLEHKKRLFLSPHRVLHALPLHALRWRGGYLLEAFAVTYVPNMSTLLRCATAPADADVLAVGVSHSEAPPADSFKPLTDAGREVQDMVDLYGEQRCRPFLEHDATESTLVQLNASGDLKQFGVLHFACHGLNIDSDNPMESKLFLRDSALDGLDIATWQIDAHLVVLSACCSGQRPVAGRGMEELPGDDLFGLQAAFFAAGADLILSTMWPVDSKSARTIALAFHRRLKAGVAAEFALQQAVVEFLEDARTSKSLKRQRPYTWAPFFLAACTRIN